MGQQDYCDAYDTLSTALYRCCFLLLEDHARAERAVRELFTIGLSVSKEVPVGEEFFLRLLWRVCNKQKHLLDTQLEQAVLLYAVLLRQSPTQIADYLGMESAEVIRLLRRAAQQPCRG